MLFTKNKKIEHLDLKLYDQTLERVPVFKYLDLWFDEKLTWKLHISKIESKCRMIINCMRTVASHNWGASRSALLCIKHWFVHALTMDALYMGQQLNLFWKNQKSYNPEH